MAAGDVKGKECSWCEVAATKSKLIAGLPGDGDGNGSFGGGIYMYACDHHEEQLNRIKPNKKIRQR